MRIQISESAVNQLSELGFDSKANALLLYYETDGCGCVVNGVSSLKEIARKGLTEEERFVTVSPDSYDVAVQKRVEWVYDEAMTIDYSSSANTFQLKSPNQMLNPRMPFEALKLS